MGNAILRCFKGGNDDTPPPAPPHRHGVPCRPQFMPSATIGLTNLIIHVMNFETNSVVPFLCTFCFILYNTLVWSNSIVVWCYDCLKT